MSEQRKIRVAVVFGGRGPEHPVSVMGGGNMLSAIDRSKYEVIPIGITTDGHWVQVADEPGKLAITDGELPSVEAVAVPGSQVVPWAGGQEAAGGLPVLGSAAGTVASAPAQIPHLFGDVDVVLPVLHGPVRRGRHDPGPAGDGGRALRRGRRAGQRRQHGQGVHEPDLRGQGACPSGPYVVVKRT